jgi:membrane protein DedA with SNARE-associated domain
VLLAALIAVPGGLGYPLMALLVFLECLGLPVPGETALIVAGGRLDLPLVILVGAGAAVLGDTCGYWIGRRGGRALLLHEGPWLEHRTSLLEKADRYFERYGIATVFLARWLPGLRVIGAASAGAARMRWSRFAPANAAGALGWAASVATVASLAGETGSLVIAACAWTIAVVAAVVAYVRRRRARARAGRPEATATA